MSGNGVDVPGWRLQLQAVLSAMVVVFALVLAVGLEDKARSIATIVFLLALGSASLAFYELNRLRRDRM